MVQRVKMGERRRRQAEEEVRFQAAMDRAKAEGHDLWMRFGACTHFNDGHDVNCRCHNGSPVVLREERT